MVVKNNNTLYMIQYIIECITGLLAGLFLGITGMPTIGFFVINTRLFKNN